MQGVLPLAVELWTFESPGGLQITNFFKCWASPPPTLGQSRGATNFMFFVQPSMEFPWKKKMEGGWNGGEIE